MRPLIVLLLVLVAAGALVLALGLFSSGSDTTDAAGPAVALQAPAQTPGRPELAPVQPAQTSQRGAAQAVAGEPIQADPELQSPGRGNRLVGRVLDSDGRALGGAQVKLSRDPMMGEELTMVWMVGKQRTGKSISVATDGGGRYVFEDIAPARDYYLLAVHPEFSQIQESHINVGEEGEFIGPDIVMRAGSRLTGTVTDVGGALVPGAKLFLDSAYNVSWEEPNPDRLVAESDSYGTYEFRNVPQGPRTLMVQASGYGVQVIQGQLTFTGEIGEELSHDFVLEPGLPIVGQVVGPEGQGVARAQVIAVNFQNQVTSRGEAISDDNGRFQIDDLRQGPYIIMVNAPGFSQARMNRIEAGKVDVVIELQRQACVSGTVVAQGQPAPSFKIEVRQTTPNPTPGAPQIFESTQLGGEFSAADGGFRVCGFEGGHFNLVVTAPGFAPTHSQVFQVINNQDPPPLTIVLSSGGRLHGRVLDPEGAPVSGAAVRSADNLMPDAEEDPFFGILFSGTATARKTRTNVEGYFDLPALAPASYKLIIDHPRFASRTISDLNVNEGQTTELGDVRLLAGGVVRGTVRDQLGQALTRGFVQLNSTSEPGLIYQTRSDAEGGYDFQNVRPGSYKLSATRSSPGSSSDPFQAILDQQASEVSISVSDGATLTRDLSLGS